MHALIRPLIILMILIVIGVVGYVVIEGWSVLESAYMVAITLSTVGFTEVRDMTPFGRAFTILLIAFGISTGAYAIGKLGETIVEGQLQGVARRRRMQHFIHELQSHYIVCGFGRVGRQTCEELSHEGTQFVVIERNPALEPELKDLGYLHVIGDAAEDEVLTLARIDHAAGVAVSADNDANTLFITLTARAMNERARIVAVARDTDSVHKLHRAGATRVVSPFLIAGRRIARMVLRPTIVDFLDTVAERSGEELRLEELRLNEGSELIGQTLMQSHLRRRAGVLILGIKKPDGNYIINPTEEFTFAAEQTVIALGTGVQLQKLAALVGGPGA